MSRTLSMNFEVGRELERLGLVGLQAEGRPPDVADGGLAHAVAAVIERVEH